MADSTRAERLKRDWETLQALMLQSTIFEVTASGEPPDQYRVLFKGKGLARDPGPAGDAKVVEQHEIELRLPYSYPDRPPDVRWLSPLHHPNVSFSGFVNFRELGLDWNNTVGLDVVLDRLWDVARFAYVEREPCSNVAARNWLDGQAALALPVDERPLRDRVATPSSNVIKYVRRGAAKPVPIPSGDVLYIGDDTPAPNIPKPPAPQRRAGDSDDVLYIE